MKKFLTFILSLVIMFSSGALLLSAQVNPGRGSTENPGRGSAENSTNFGITFDNPFSGGDSLFELLETIIEDILMPIGGILAVLAFIYAGFLYVTARGDENTIKRAHNALLYAAIGTAILLGSFVLAKVIENTVNQLKV